MKVSELVAELEVLWAEHGDLDVLASDFGCGCCGDLDTPDPHIYKLERRDLIYWDTSDMEEGAQVIRLNR